MALLRRSVWVVLFVAAVWSGMRFSNENAEPVSIHYVIGTLHGVPLWLALVGSFAVGLAAAFAAFAGRLARASLAQRRYRKTVAALESEVHQLRNLPVEAGGVEEPVAPSLVAPAEPGA